MAAIILGSSSPRRQFLLRETGLTFTVEKPDVDEEFPVEMPVRMVPSFLARKKADYFRQRSGNGLFITADTVVILGDMILNKPADRNEAIGMLTRLSGQTHLVITAVCLMTQSGLQEFDEHTHVTFYPLSQASIEAYVDNYKPFDKAGSYGAQECLPEGFDPCSGEEIEFLKKIGDPGLVQRSITRLPGQGGMTAIKKIDGSFFNVMGLPIVKLSALIGETVKW